MNEHGHTTWPCSTSGWKRRVAATCNASLHRFASDDLPGGLAASGSVAFDVAYPDGASIGALSTARKRVLQAHYVAEVLQRIDADVVLVNEFDYDFDGTPGTGSTPSPLGYQSRAARRFNGNVLVTRRRDRPGAGAAAIHRP